MADDLSEGREVPSNPMMTAEAGTVAMLAEAEINQAIATAHRFPRSLKKFRDEALQMVTLTEDIAKECIYSLPRDGKVIEGPSARFAEVIASAWGNCRAGARVVNENSEFVTTQGVFHDLERNVSITYEVQRRITDKYGKRYKPDMIGVTANAGCSIALRNAILKGVPKAFWSSMYQAARRTVMGDFKTLSNRRADALKEFQAFAVTKEMICGTLGVAGVEDIGLEQLVTLHGLLTAIKDGDTTVEQAFGAPENHGIKSPQRKTDAPAPQAQPQQQAPQQATTADKTAPAAQQQSAAPTQAPASGTGKPLTEGEVKVLRGKLAAAQLTAEEMCHATGLKQLEAGAEGDFGGLCAWIKTHAAAEA